MIGLMWYLMGMMTIGAIWGYTHIRQSYAVSFIANSGLILSFAALWMCVGWSWASFAEGEPQSGAMGLICFGMPSIILFNVTWKRFIAPAKKIALSN